MLGAEEYFNTYIKNFKVTILSEEINKNDKTKATVKISVEKIDMQSIFEEYIAKIYSTLFTDTTKSEDDIEQDSNAFFLEKVNDPNVKKITKEYSLNLINIDNEWKIVNDDNLSTAILDVESTNSSNSSIDSNTPNPTI